MNPIDDLLVQPGGVAARLRDARVAAGMNGKQLADAMGCAPSKVSRIELGRQTPTEPDIQAWATATRAGAGFAADTVSALRAVLAAKHDWRQRMRAGQAAVQAGYNRLVLESTTVRNFETAFVPGLLQTPAYARNVLAEMVRIHELDVDDVDESVATRMRRQQVLYDPGRRFEFLLAEPVLRWRLCPAEVMAGQLDRLQAVIGMTNVRLGVLPLDAPISVTPQNSFCLFDDMTVVETFVGEQAHVEQESVVYGRMLDLLWADAVTGEDARRLITAAARSLTDR